MSDKEQLFSTDSLLNSTQRIEQINKVGELFTDIYTLTLAAHNASLTEIGSWKLMGGDLVRSVGGANTEIVHLTSPQELSLSRIDANSQTAMNHCSYSFTMIGEPGTYTSIRYARHHQLDTTDIYSDTLANSQQSALAKTQGETIVLETLTPYQAIVVLESLRDDLQLATVSK